MRHTKIVHLALVVIAMVAGCQSESTDSIPVGTAGGAATTGGVAASSGNANGTSTTNPQGGSPSVGGLTFGGNLGTNSMGGSVTVTAATAGSLGTGGSLVTAGGVASTTPKGGGSSSGGTTASTTAKGGATSTSTTSKGGASSSGGTATSTTSKGGATSTSTTSKGGASSSGGTATGTTAKGGATSTGGTSSTGTYRPCPTDGSVCKIMPFGDSITDGYNGDTPGGYRVELFRLAHQAGKNITFVGTGWNGPSTVDGAAFPPNHEGHSGYTIDPAGSRKGISPLVATVMPQFTPHIVLLMIGTNDAIDNYDMANAPTRLGTLIDSIYAKLPNVLIVVAKPVPSRGDSTKGDDTGLTARLQTFGAAIPAVVQARANAGKHILLVDMFTPFLANKAALLEDQWHPNLAGYVIIGTEWYKSLAGLL